MFNDDPLLGNEDRIIGFPKTSAAGSLMLKSGRGRRWKQLKGGTVFVPYNESGARTPKLANVTGFTEAFIGGGGGGLYKTQDFLTFSALTPTFNDSNTPIEQVLFTSFNGLLYALGLHFNNGAISVISLWLSTDGGVSFTRVNSIALGNSDARPLDFVVGEFGGGNQWRGFIPTQGNGGSSNYLGIYTDFNGLYAVINSGSSVAVGGGAAGGGVFANDRWILPTYSNKILSLPITAVSDNQNYAVNTTMIRPLSIAYCPILNRCVAAGISNTPVANTLAVDYNNSGLGDSWTVATVPSGIVLPEAFENRGMHVINLPRGGFVICYSSESSTVPDGMLVSMDGITWEAATAVDNEIFNNVAVLCHNPFAR